MSWTRVQSHSATNPGGSGTSFSLAFSSPVTAGNLIVACISANSPGTVTAQDSVNSTLYNLVSLYPASGQSCGMWWYVPPLGGSSFTVEIATSASTLVAIALAEYSFAGTVSADGSPATYFGSSATPTASAMTPSGNDLAVAACCTGGLTFTGAGAGYTGGEVVAYTGGHNFGLVEEYALNQTGSITPSMTFLSAGTCALVGALFIASSVGALITPYAMDGLHGFAFGGG